MTFFFRYSLHSRLYSLSKPNIRTSQCFPRSRIHFASSTPLRSFRRPIIGLVSAGLALSLGGTVYADSVGHSVLQTSQSLSDLIRSYIVFSMCSVPVLVDNSPKLLSVLTSIPGVKQVTEALVRVTFFEQFVGGDSAEDTLPLLHQLRSANKGALFAYSVEVDEAEAAGSKKKKQEKPKHKQIVDEMVRCIDVAADFEDSVVGKVPAGRKTWVAVKMTALVPDAQTLINFSSYIVAHRPQLPVHIAFPGCPDHTDLAILYNSDMNSRLNVDTPNTLTQDDIEALRGLHVDLIRICTRAQERGVRVIIDAEYSWYQPAIDALTLSLMRQFNQLPNTHNSGSLPVLPLVYGTYQAYLRRTPTHLAQSLIDAKKHNYALGAKLVRGAYHPHEMAAHLTRHTPDTTSSATPFKNRSTPISLSISPDDYPPVWPTKEETDECYNRCAKVLISAIKDDVDVSGSARSKQSFWWKGSWTRATSWVPTIGVLFGTHNWTSCNLILDELVKNGLATEEQDGTGQVERIIRVGDDVTERVTLGQLYGMSNALTDYLVARARSSSPLIIKYVPYGALSEVMPYLSRRAIENKSVLGDGGAADERRRAGTEIRKRLFG